MLPGHDILKITHSEWFTLIREKVEQIVLFLNSEKQFLFCEHACCLLPYNAPLKLQMFRVDNVDEYFIMAFGLSDILVLLDIFYTVFIRPVKITF